MVSEKWKKQCTSSSIPTPEQLNWKKVEGELNLALTGSLIKNECLALKVEMLSVSLTELGAAFKWEEPDCWKRYHPFYF